MGVLMAGTFLFWLFPTSVTLFPLRYRYRAPTRLGTRTADSPSLCPLTPFTPARPPLTGLPNPLLLPAHSCLVYTVSLRLRP
jgi:hypothetical protein